MIRKILLAFLLIPLATFSQETKKVLFLGNSYTAVNNLPNIISALATSTGDALVFDSNTPGGQTLQQHVQNAVSTNKIAQGNWDFVVLQEQSQVPSFPDGYVNANFFPAAQSLNNLITANNPCAETVFYMTWGRRDGDPQNCPSWPPVCTFEGMNNLIANRYSSAAHENQGIVSPVGAVWKNIRENFPAIELYSSDGSHPSLAGSYLAACTFYTVLYRKNPMLIATDYSLPAADAANIRMAVKNLVYDNLPNWNVGAFDPVAQFSFTEEDNTFSFQNTSTFASDYGWDFGDGTTSTLSDPSHNYAIDGVYEVTLTAKSCGFLSSTTTIITYNALGTNENLESKTMYYPNPVRSELQIKIPKVDAIFLIDNMGKSFTPSYQSTSELTKIDFSDYDSGFYIVKIFSDNKWSAFKIIKE